MAAMSPRDRHQELLRLLRRRSDWTADALAAELGVSRRTILRDVNDLRNEGFHITSMTGPGGGLHLEPTSVMVTSQLAGDEVVALILSVALAKATPWMPFATGADQALAKIEAALPAKRVAEVQQLMQRILVGEAATLLPNELGEIDAGLVNSFEQSFTNTCLLSFKYTNANSHSSTRSVEPHGLLVRAPLWYVIAWDPQPDAPRLFRADRIRAPSATDRPFVPRPHDLVTGICPDAKPAAGQSI